MPCRAHAGQEGQEGEGREAHRGAEAAQDCAQGRADGGRDLGRGAPTSCVCLYASIVLQIGDDARLLYSAFLLLHPSDRPCLLAGALHRTHVRGAASSTAALPSALPPPPPPPPFDLPSFDEFCQLPLPRVHFFAFFRRTCRMLLLSSACILRSHCIRILLTAFNLESWKQTTSHASWTGPVGR